MGARMNAQIDKMKVYRTNIAGEIEILASRLGVLQIALETWDQAIAVAGSPDDQGEATHERRARGSVKDTALRLIQEHAEHGLTAVELVEVAGAEGIKLDRGSISSLLSKLKSGGTLSLKGSKYLPAETMPAKLVVAPTPFSEFGERAA